MTRVVVAGGGCAAALLLVHLARTGTAVEVVVVEPRATIGRGTAYSTTDPAHLLNVRAGSLGAHVDDVDDFVRWLGGRGHDPATQPFQPRMRYGDYLQERAEAAIRLIRERGGSVRHVRGTACGVRVRRRLEVQVERDGEELALVADHVVAAVGPPPSGLPAAWVGAVPGAREHDDPWSAGVVEGARAVVLVGSGLTAVDIALSTCAANPEAVVLACSRSGERPRAHHVEPGAPAGAVDLQAFDSVEPAADALAEAFSESVRRAEAAGQGWRDVVDALRGRTQSLWASLATAQRRAWLDRYGRAWDVRRHRMAPSVAARMRQLEQDGRLRFVAGTVGAVVDGLPSGGDVRVVNCTGFGSSIVDHPDPFVRSLLRRRIAEPEPLRLGLHAVDQPRLPGTLHVIGALRRGDLFETTAVPELRSQAAAIAAAIVS